MSMNENNTNYKDYDPDTLKHLQTVIMDIFKDFIEICDENDIQYFLHAGTTIGAVRHGGFIPWDDEIDVAMLREDYEKLLKILDKENGKYYISNLKKRFKIDDDNYTPKTLLCLKNTKLKQQEQECTLYDFGIYIDINVLDEIPEKKIERFLFIKTVYFVKFLIFLTHSVECDVYTSKTNEFIGHRIKFLFGHFNIPNIALKIFTKLIKKYQGKCEMLCSPGEGVWIERDFHKSCFNQALKVKFEDTCANIPVGYDEVLKVFYGNYMEIPPISERFNHNWKIIDFGEY
ncbi:LicD family protein [Methanobrevibacter millerae]|uniref:Lipopolysaccharide cholinephosphotransferase n=1 Tax=Methanobrevibacter millerae TaxID=230361 RepID=A0A1G5WY78_9EURY|nr:LicD family protein [Methanobrevibacter millerae]SDA62477.1 lipopolysaccharide cholinephosphotransferase [Methanobrevibacter millerae]